MAKFRMKSPGKPVEANGYVFEHGKVTEVRDDDEATLRKLRTHPCFERVD
jgi:hypothetical protein